MTDRDSKDEAIDSAIEMLIDDELEEFVLIARIGGDMMAMHRCGADAYLLSIYLLVENARQLFEGEEGYDPRGMGPHSILDAAGVAAEREGVLHGSVERQYGSGSSHTTF